MTARTKLGTGRKGEKQLRTVRERPAEPPASAIDLPQEALPKGKQGCSELTVPRTHWKTLSLRSSLSFLSLTVDPTRGNSGLSGGAIAGIVVGAVAGVALVGALAYFLYFRKTGG